MNRVLRSGIPQSLVAEKARQILVYCNDGAATGPEATHRLVQAGFTGVANLQTGIEGCCRRAAGDSGLSARRMRCAGVGSDRPGHPVR